jgi:PQQ-like domain
MKNSRLAASLLWLVVPSLGPAQTGSHDWLTWGGDPERAGYAPAETAISKENASSLDQIWNLQLDTAPKVEVLSTLTAPLVVEAVTTPQGAKDLVFVVGSDDTIYSIDAAAGKVFWKKRFPNDLKPLTRPTYLCPNTQNATPVIDKVSGVIYLLTSDGKLRGLSIVNGEDRIPPTDFAPPHARTWSLNLIDGVMYTPIARGCGGTISNFAAMDLNNPAHPQVHYYTSIGRPAGGWGRGGLVRGPKGVYGQTADGPYDPAAGKFGNSVVALNAKDLRLLDSFTPSNWQFLNTKDLDLGSASPIVFPFQKWQLVATSSKEAVIFLLDANSLGGADHHTPLHQSRWGNDDQQLWGRGVWGSMASWQDSEAQRWLLVPMWGPPAKSAAKFQFEYGPSDKGSVMAFKLGVENEKPTLIPVWMSRDMHVPDPPLVANGVVFVVATGENTRQGGFFPPEVRAKPVSHAIFYALDAATGKELYSSGNLIDSWAHFGGLAISKGRLYFCTQDGRVHAFGIKK